MNELNLTLNSKATLLGSKFRYGCSLHNYRLLHSSQAGSLYKKGHRINGFGCQSFVFAAQEEMKATFRDSIQLFRPPHVQFSIIGEHERKRRKDSCQQKSFKR